MREKRFKISYVKKPFARNSLVCLPTAVAAFLFCVVSLRLSIAAQGNGGLSVGAWGISSLLFAVVSFWYGIHALLEKEKNYILARIGMILSGILVIFWVCLVAVGLRG